MNQRYIEVVDYSHDWPLACAREAANIKHALGDNCLEVHHIGSTSVVGLAAKPIIDMLPVVRDIRAVDQHAMEALGYEAKGEFGIPFRRFFTKGQDLRTHNAHVFEQGNSEIERHLKFRDWMRNHPADRDAYAELKKSLAKKFPNDIESYCLGKEGFIANIDAQAGWDGVKFVVAMTPKEWEAYHRIGKEHAHPSLAGENHCHFVFYKGVKIVGAAHVECLNAAEVAKRFLATDEPFKEHGYESYMMHILEKWIHSQGFVVAA